VRDWLSYGLNGRAATSSANYTGLVEQHIVPSLGARRLRDLSAEDRRPVTQGEVRDDEVVAAAALDLEPPGEARGGSRRGRRNVVALCDGGCPEFRGTSVAAR
jgi:hypothetical protein